MRERSACSQNKLTTKWHRVGQQYSPKDKCQWLSTPHQKTPCTSQMRITTKSSLQFSSTDWTNVVLLIKYLPCYIDLQWNACPSSTCHITCSYCWAHYNDLAKKLSHHIICYEQIRMKSFLNIKIILHLSKTCKGEILPDVAVPRTFKTSHQTYPALNKQIVLYISCSKVKMHQKQIWKRKETRRNDYLSMII